MRTILAVFGLLGDEAGVARREVVRTALAIWSDGALEKR